MAEYETGYQTLETYYDDEEQEAPPTENIIHLPDCNKARWNHIEDLDEFFTRVYHYHQRAGFTCMLVQDALQIMQFVFVVVFSVFLVRCVDYPVLFHDKPHYDSSHKVTLREAVFPLSVCIARINLLTSLCLLLAALFCLFRLFKLVYMIFKYLEIRTFYLQALNISSVELPSMTWHEVQHRLLQVQREQQLCIHKQELTQLDIYHRILRFKNYMVAMVNKSLIPLSFHLPFVGEYVFLSSSLKFNLEMLLFWGPWSPFENNWHLKQEYKCYNKRKELAAYLSRRMLWVGIANLILCPVIFLWQILYSFFRYAEVIKREPGMLGSRTWSLYSRLYLRHFNELDHEFNARLNRGYRPASRYMNIFTSPLLVVVTKYMSFFTGSMLAVLVILTVIDEDVLAVQNVIGIMTVLGLVVTICQACIPDEHLVWCPELLLKAVLAHIHYMPDSWKGNAHTAHVREEFSTLFQYKALYLLEEMVSPLVTPLLICLRVRHRALEIVDFYRNFTIDVVGVGDVCSFAQMDIRRHGNRQWVVESHTDASQYHQAEDGKTEMSLIHFTLTNPEWHPPQTSNIFIHTLKEQAQRDASTMSLMPMGNPLLDSLNSLTSIGQGYSSMMSSVTMHGSAFPASVSGGATYQPAAAPAAVRGGLRHTEGPLGGSTVGLLSSIGADFPAAAVAAAPIDEGVLETLSTEMSFSALYLHEVRHRRRRPPPGGGGPGPAPPGAFSSGPPSSEPRSMPHIAEERTASDDDDDDSDVTTLRHHADDELSPLVVYGGSTSVPT